MFIIQWEKMRLYLKYVAMQLKADLEYKKAFALSLFFKMLSALSALVSIVFMFDKFGSLADYKFEDVLICFVMSFLGFSLAECFFRSFDHFDRILSNGEFDRILVRPRSVILQVLGSEVEFNRIGRAFVAIVIFFILLASKPELMQPTKFATLLLMIIGNIVVYAALFILKAGITFFTTQSLEIMNIFTDGARDLTQYPLSIYQKWVQRLFTYIIPISLVNYYPLLYVIGKTNNKLYMLLPFVAMLFVIPCYAVWSIGLKKYKSTGS